ncbi:hypothetical protein WJX79_000157 [Trebouxia sp. C0005]
MGAFRSRKQPRFGMMGDSTWNLVDGDETLPVSTAGQQQSGSPRRGFRFTADKTFETTVMHTLLAGGLADVWHVASVGHLVALAGQACKEVAMAADATRMQPDSRFTERLRSTQMHLTCAEANLGSEADNMPLIVMAISEDVLPWPAYAEHYSKFAESLQGETLQGHFHPGVQAAAAELPLQQLAWLLSDQPCRLIICGKGLAGAVAQHAAMTVQHMLQLPMSDQETCKLPERVLCITFGAPPSSLYSPDGADPDSDMVSAKPVVPELIWNFLLANAANNVKEMAESAMRKISALQKVARRRFTDENDLRDSIDKVLAAGTVQDPEYMGQTWFLASNGESVLSAKLGKVLDIDRFAFSGLSREPFKEYYLAVDRLGAATMHTQPQQPSGVLKPFKLESIIKGFFKPLTGVAPSASNIEAAVTPMVGCHITLQGVGVQWICSKALQVEMTGGDYGMLRFELDAPKVNPIKAHSGTPTEELLDLLDLLELSVDNLSAGPDYSLTKQMPRWMSSCSSAHILDSKELLYAASRLVSVDSSSQRAGLEILNVIDNLESWCRACPEGLDKGFNNRASKTFSETAWDAKSIQALVEACLKVAAGRPANMFSELDKVGKRVINNTRSIAAVLAAPVVLEYVTDYQKTGVGILIFLGCVAASVMVPPFGYALAVSEAAALWGGVAVLATSFKVTYGISQGVWAWLSQMFRYNRAYQTKLEQLIGAPTVSCKQVLSTQLNQICAMAQLRNRVWLTEFREFDQKAAQFKARNIKSAEDVRHWICNSAQNCGFDIPDVTA